LKPAGKDPRNAKGHNMTSIYDQHSKHTRRTGAYAILKDGEHVANVTIAFPADGAGRLYAYVHWIGTLMVRGSANGYGYDKRSAAVASAARKHLATLDKGNASTAECMFWEYISEDRGIEWNNRLRDAGFTVCQVC
jgi:hypothetical protein